MMRVLHLLSCASAAMGTYSASTICVYNYAGFVLRWKLQNVDDSNETAKCIETESTPIYAIGQVKCIEAAALAGLQPGAQLAPVVDAVGGKWFAGESVTYDPINATQVTYVCRGGTFDYTCKAEKPPATAVEVAEMVGEFLLGFVEGLGADIGFSDCLADINQTHSDLVDLVSFFEDGINTVRPDSLVKAFKLVGKLLNDFGASINECVKDATNLQQQFQMLAAELSGDPLGTIIKVVVKEGVTIFNNRADLTADCKAITADWKAGDFRGSGHAVGDIIGVIINGMRHYTARTSAVVPSNYTASTICVYNYAGFALKWKLYNVDNKTETSMTSIYPLGQVTCIEAADLEGVQAGTVMVPVVNAIWGKTNTAPHSVTYDPFNATQLTYVCRGSTMIYSCKPEKPPPTAAEVAKDVGEFLYGFAEGLGAELNFTDCLTDIDETHSDLGELVTFLEDGVNKLQPGFIVQAFQLMGKVAKSFGVAIKECIASAENLREEFEKIAASLMSGNILGTIIEVIVKEGMQIWHHRKDLTADCKAVAADWKAGDFRGSGHAVGDIIGILLNGLTDVAEVKALEAPTLV